MERPATSERTDIALGGEVLPPGAEPLQAGDPPVIDGHRLTGRLASGGTSVVYLARGPEGEPVALKSTRVRPADQAQARRWLRNEAACARRVPAFCTARPLVDGSDHTPPYLVSEYVDGPSIGQYVEFLGPLDADQLRALASALARAIAAVHDAGLIHCDLKPGNVLLAADGPRVIDFSIAQETPGSDAEVGTVPYSPGWVAPERLRGRPAGPATDIFGWGCLVGFAALGRSLFDGEDPGPGRWTVARSADLAVLDEPLRALVEAALAVDPADRPSLGEITARLVGSGGAPAEAPAPEALAPEPEAPVWSAAPGATAEPFAARDVPPAVPAFDEPTAPMARIAPEPAYEPDREPEPERAYEPGPPAAWDSTPAAAYEPEPEPAYEPPPEPAHGPAYGGSYESRHEPGPPAPAGDLVPLGGRGDTGGHDQLAHVPGFGREAPAGRSVDPMDAFGPRDEHRPRRSRRLRAVALVTAPAALVAVLATVIAMAGTGTSTTSPGAPAGAPTAGQGQDPSQAQGPVDSPSAALPHRRSYGPRPASASSAPDDTGPPMPTQGGGGGQTRPGGPGHSHRPGSPTTRPTPTPTHSPTPSPTPSPTGGGGGDGGGGGTTPTG